MDPTGEERQTHSDGEEKEMWDSVWDFSVVNLEWDICVDTVFKVDLGQSLAGRREQSSGD